MSQQGEKPVGLTKDVGWQIGARRTLNIPLEQAWDVLTSTEGVNIWLGTPTDLMFAKKAPYQLADGTTGEIRVFKPYSHLRMTWQPPKWDSPSTIQVRVMPSGDKTVIAFHQENMQSSEQREERRAFYQSALDQLEQII